MHSKNLEAPPLFKYQVGPAFFLGGGGLRKCSDCYVVKRGQDLLRHFVEKDLCLERWQKCLKQFSPGDHF